MAILEETENYIKGTIDHSVGLPVSNHTLNLKILALQDSLKRLRDHSDFQQIKLKDKDDQIDLARAEASMNAQALKKFVEENQKLAMECANLLSQHERLEKECSLYDKDREALMEFGNEADERARNAETRVSELEEELCRISKEVQFYKHQQDVSKGDLSSKESVLEQCLLDSLLTTLVGNDEVTQNAHALLEAGGLESFQMLLTQWNSLRPSTQKVMALGARVKTLETDKDHLRINLTKAEEEVNLLFKENKILDKENKRLMRKEKRHPGSDEKSTSGASAKRSRRKFSPIEGIFDLNEDDSPRLPLSSLQHNFPEAKTHQI